MTGESDTSSCTSTCGCSLSSRIAGAFGISSDSVLQVRRAGSGKLAIWRCCGRGKCRSWSRPGLSERLNRIGAGCKWPVQSEQRRQLAFAIERRQFVEAADMGVPMKICGTVRRPVRAIISSRRTGSRSMRTFSIVSTPRAFSRASARRQYGHTLSCTSQRRSCRSPLPQLRSGRPASRHAARPPPRTRPLQIPGCAASPRSSGRRAGAQMSRTACSSSVRQPGRELVRPAGLRVRPAAIR